MSEHLSIHGTLAETTVPDLFRSLIRSNETGIVSLESIGRHDDVYISGGRIVYASSSDPDVGLGEVALRSGEIDLEQYRDAIEQVSASKSIGSLLCELGHLQADQLVRIIEKQVSTIVTHCLTLRTGSYKIEFTEEFPSDIVSLTLNTDRLVLDGVGRIEHWSLISRGVGRMDRLLRHSPGADARVYHLDLTDEESHVHSLLSDAQTVEAICRRSYLSNFATCRTAWALLTVNLAEEGESSELDARRAAEEGELVLESDVEKYNTAFQRIFSLVEAAIGDRIYDFLDRIVGNLSPETLPYLSGVNLMNEGRVDFDQLFNNLVSSGTSDSRTAAHNVLNELLYGWILEIRTEFGNDFEKDVHRILESLRR